MRSVLLALALAGACAPAVSGSPPSARPSDGSARTAAPVEFAAPVDPPILAGFLFSYPPRAGHPENPANKILWVVSTGRIGPLVVDAHPLGAAEPRVRYSFPDSSGPGNIYPSGVDVPVAGCRHRTFTWDGRTAELDLAYR